MNDTERGAMIPARTDLRTTELIGQSLTTVMGLIEVAKHENPETALSRVVVERLRGVRNHLEVALVITAVHGESDGRQTVLVSVETSIAAPVFPSAVRDVIAPAAPPQETGASSSDPVHKWTVTAAYVLGGWSEDVADPTGLASAVTRGIRMSPVGEVVVREYKSAALAVASTVPQQEK